MRIKRETIGNSTLYLGNCEDILPTLKPVQLVVTDPPYELSDNSPNPPDYFKSLQKFDDNQFKELTNSFNIEPIFKMMRDICKPFHCFCFCSNKQISRLMTINEEQGFPTTLLVWHKTNAVPFANGVWRGDIEYIVHIREQGSYFQGDATIKKKVFNHPIVVNQDHPTKKPLQLLINYVLIGSEKHNTVLDPFMGSGTTGEACIATDRHFIGIEQNPKHFETAVRTIEKAYKDSQHQMFKHHELRTSPKPQTGLLI